MDEGTAVANRSGELRLLVELYYDLQGIRIKDGNAIGDYDRKGLIDKETSKVLSDFIDERALKMEKELKSKIDKLVRDFPIWEHWLGGVKGIGPCIAGGLLCKLDIRKASSPSAFFKICGLHVDNATGLAVRRQKGVKIDWDPFLKRLCFLASESFVKTHGYYRKEYDKFRAEYDAKQAVYDNAKAAETEKAKAEGRPPDFSKLTPACPKERRGERHSTKKGGKVAEYDCPDIHRHRMAERKTVKLFLSHLWEVWRKLEGLPIVPPYPIALLKHDPSHYIPPPPKEKET